MSDYQISFSNVEAMLAQNSMNFQKLIQKEENQQQIEEILEIKNQEIQTSPLEQQNIIITNTIEDQLSKILEKDIKIMQQIISQTKNEIERINSNKAEQQQTHHLLTKNLKEKSSFEYSLKQIQHEKNKQYIIILKTSIQQSQKAIKKIEEQINQQQQIYDSIKLIDFKNQ